MSKKMKICLAGNSGGHLNELLQISPFYSKYNYFFVTDKNKMSLDLGKKNKVYFVQKFVFKAVFKKLQFLRPIKNVLQTLKIFRKEKPDVIITTGAGTAFGTLILGKLFRKKVIFIESAARVDAPSIFGKYIGSKADYVLVQWKNLQTHFKDAIYISLNFNLKQVNPEPITSIQRIFVSGGTYKLQFNRLLKKLDKLKENGILTCDITAQIGASDYIPKHYESFDYCTQKEAHEYVNSSDLIICQGGCGSIFDALTRGKRVIAVPRLVEYSEFFDNHQVELVKELENKNLIMAVYDKIDILEEKLKNVLNFTPNFNGFDEPMYFKSLSEICNKSN